MDGAGANHRPSISSSDISNVFFEKMCVTNLVLLSFCTILIPNVLTPAEVPAHSSGSTTWNRSVGISPA
jgi:hypothetical protein